VIAITRPLVTGFTRTANAAACGLLLILLGLPAINAGAVDEMLFETADGVDISVTRFAADGEYLVLWLAPEYGFRQAHRSLAEQLSVEGIEVWQGDLVEALFMPPGTASLKQLDGSYVAELIDHAYRQTSKRIVVAGDSYAAMIALRGARQWQQKAPPQRYLAGAVLFSPYSFAAIPPLGLPPQYLPIVESTNIPLMIFQAEGSATYGEFETLLQKLRQHGSPVYTRLVKGVMSLFYEDPPTDAMLAAAQPLARSIRQVLPLLAQHGYPLQAVPLAAAAPAESGIDFYLREFRGHSRPSPIRLDDIDGKSFVRTDFSGKVTLVNFWATWCPPCIEEIPSLNRLKTKLAGRPFELVSINYAQDRNTVLDFMQRVKVDFPVLLDLEGEHANAWQVISYPSTFVIDRTGNIRYGVNAAIDWDAPELIDRLEALMR
jgi:thiol-disulfide isomerase/thioredoxin